MITTQGEEKAILIITMASPLKKQSPLGMVDRLW